MIFLKWSTIWCWICVAIPTGYDSILVSASLPRFQTIIWFWCLLFWYLFLISMQQKIHFIQVLSGASWVHIGWRLCIHPVQVCSRPRNTHIDTPRGNLESLLKLNTCFQTVRGNRSTGENQCKCNSQKIKNTRSFSTECKKCVAIMKHLCNMLYLKRC